MCWLCEARRELAGMLAAERLPAGDAAPPPAAPSPGSEATPPPADALPRATVEQPAPGTP